jgi:hypothetical protein
MPIIVKPIVRSHLGANFRSQNTFGGEFLFLKILGANFENSPLRLSINNQPYDLTSFYTSTSLMVEESDGDGDDSEG